MPVSSNVRPRKFMSDIFISYKREERDIAEALAAALESHGWSIWWDLNLIAGERFNEVIERALMDAKCVVVLWSPRSIRSTFVRDEAYLALQLKSILPVIIEPVEIPFRFKNIHTLDITAWRRECRLDLLDNLVRDVRAIVDGIKSNEVICNYLDTAAPKFAVGAVENTRRVNLEPREIDILKLLSSGRSTTEIGTMLGISEPAVMLYLTNAEEKLGARNKHQAVLIAIRAGLL